MSKQALNLDASPTRKPGILKQGEAPQLILFNADDAQYFALDEIGSLVWEHCDGAHTSSEIINHLCEEYDAPRTTIQEDLADLISQFISRKLLAPADLFCPRSGVDAKIVP